MDDFLDFFNMYFMGSVEIIFGFYFFVRILNKKIRFYFYLLFAVCVVGIIHFIPSGIVGLGLFVLLLASGGILICHADWKLSVLYAILVVGMMQLSYGIVKSLLSMFYPMLSFWDQHIVGTAFMLSGYIASLTLAGICYHIVWKYFSNFEAVEKQYLFLLLIPILMVYKFFYIWQCRHRCQWCYGIYKPLSDAYYAAFGNDKYVLHFICL